MGFYDGVADLNLKLNSPRTLRTRVGNPNRGNWCSSLGDAHLSSTPHVPILGYRRWIVRNIECVMDSVSYQVEFSFSSELDYTSPAEEISGQSGSFLGGLCLLQTSRLFLFSDAGFSGELCGLLAP
jgi:hypothetical protein